MAEKLDYVPIQREVRLVEPRLAAYILPPHGVLSGVQLNDGEQITTAIFWMLGSRPDFVPERHLEGFTEEEQRDVQEQQEDSTSDQLLVFLGMAGIMCLVKQVRNTGPAANVDYLQKRWQAICSAMGIANIFAAGGEINAARFVHLVNSIVAWQTWIKSRAELRTKILRIALEDTSAGTRELIKKALEQIKMILTGYGLKSVEIMLSFLISDRQAIYLQPIMEQLIRLKRTVEELRQQHGNLYPYIRVFPLPGAYRLNIRFYPDLYYAAISTAIANKDLGFEGRYLMTDVKTTISKSMIEHAANKFIGAGHDAYKKARMNLERLGIQNPERFFQEHNRDDKPPSRRPQMDLACR